MNRSVGEKPDQPTLQECFLAKFKSPTPKKMPPLGRRNGNKDATDVKPSIETMNKRLPKRNCTPPQGPPKRQRISHRNQIANDSDSDDDNNNILHDVEVKPESKPVTPKKVSTSVRSSPRKSSPCKLSPRKQSPRKAAIKTEKNGKESGSDSSDSDSDSENVEALRLRNIEDNHRFLAELGIQRTKEKIFESSPAAAAKRRDVKGLKRGSVETTPKSTPPRRVSLRQRKVDSDGLQLAPDYREPSVAEIRLGLVRKPRIVSGVSGAKVDVRVSGSTGAATSDDKSGRKPTTPTPLNVFLSNPPMDEVDEDDLTIEMGNGPDAEEEFKKELEARREAREKQRAKKCKGFISGVVDVVIDAPEVGRDGVKGKSEASFLADLKKLKCGETLERKVTKDRIFGLAIHPSVDQTLIAAGDKWGGVGLWTVDDSSIGEDGVHLFHPHTNPINVLRWSPESATNPKSLYTCSYDGTIRRGDFEKEVFECVFASGEDENIAVSAFAFTSPHTIVASDLSGGVSMVDTRVDGLGAVASYKVHPKSCRNVDVHPIDTQYFVTTGTEGNVLIWDSRKMDKAPKPVVTMSQSRSVNSAYFSPLTGNHILTTGMDDFHRIYDFSDKKSATVFKDLRHNNNTGRWITKFRAVWYPRREDLILSGLMGHPRQIELYSATSLPNKLQKVHEFLDAEVLGSICCVIQGHPFKPLIAGGNASGKVYVFQ